MAANPTQAEVAATAPLLDSDLVNAEIDQLLLSGRAATAFEAEEMFLNDHLDDLVGLVQQLDDEQLQRHEAIKLLMAHGSRRWEDALR
jgi:hypothetical protein